MKKASLVIAAVALVACAFSAGAWVAWRAASHPQSSKAAGRTILYWVDPMHPSYKSDKPGIAPDCGMKLEPVYADANSDSGKAPTNAFRISPDKQQTIGVTTAIAERARVERTIRTVGRVAPDENRIYRLVATIDGSVRQINGAETGSVVAKNQVLLTFYNRDFLSAQAAYFYALDALDRFEQGNEAQKQIALTRTQLRAAEETLQAMGMDDIQIAGIAKSRTAATEIQLRSPVAGYVVTRSVYPRQRFEKGAELYRIVDASRVWILTDLFENDAQYIRAGTVADIAFPYRQQARLQARVADALPQFDPSTRTLKVRLDADNSTYALRPDMLVDVEIHVSMPEALTVPADAVLDAGGRQTAFVDLGNGYMEPRAVQTGWRSGGRVEIRQGLMPGERVVLSGNFLLDSESRMKRAALGISEAATDPVCGMEVDQAKASSAGRAANYEGATYYFCSDECAKRFAASPRTYSHAAGAPPARTLPRPAFTTPHASPSVERATAAEAETVNRAVPLLPAARGMRSRNISKWVVGPSDPSSAEKETEGDKRRRDANPLAPAPLEKTSADPVTGFPVGEESAAAAGLTATYDGVRYFFQSKGTKEAFEREPTRYVKSVDRRP